MYGIIALKFTRIYGIMGANFSGKIARPCQIIGRDTPRGSPKISKLSTAREGSAAILELILQSKKV